MAVEKGLSELITRITSQSDSADLISLLGQIAEWSKLSDIDYDLATPENLFQIIRRFAVFCGFDENGFCVNGEVFKGIANAISYAPSAPIRRRVL